ncbi:MAG: hypothetical protein ABJB98_04375 [Actinomycetota bacterium]
MTNLARRLLDSLQKGVDTPPPELGTHSVADQPMRVGIRLPESLDAAFAEGLTDSLDSHLSVLLAELGLDRKPVITTENADPGAVAATVSIDQRPVAHLRCEHLSPEEAGESLLNGVIDRILRRLALLAGPDVGARSTMAYLMTLGCRAPVGTPIKAFDVDAAEKLIDARTGEEIVLEVAAPTMRRVDGDAAQALVALREREYRKWGVVYPGVTVVLTDDLPGSVRLRLNDVTLPVRHLGEDAEWIDVVRYVGVELATRRHWFVRMADMARVMDEDLVFVAPDLVAVAEANYSRAQLTAAMRELVRGGRRVRNFPRILWLLIEAGGSPAGSDILRISESPLLPKSRHRPPAGRDPIVQAVRVRKLAAEENWRLGTYRAPQHAVRLDPEIEQGLLADGQTGAALARAEWAAVRAFASEPAAEGVITRTIEALGPVREVLQAVDNVPRVAASHELPPDADVNALPVLTDPERRGLADVIQS